MFVEKGHPITRSRREALSTVLEIQEAQQVEPPEHEVPHTQVGSTQLEVAGGEAHQLESSRGGEGLVEEATTQAQTALELATQLQTQIEAGLREMIMQGSSTMPHHQIKPIEGVNGASKMEHMQHEAITSECHFEAT